MILPSISTEIAGRYCLQVVKKGKVIKDTGWFSNLITNAGLDSLGESGGIYDPSYYNGQTWPRPAFRSWHVGVGNATPQYTDTTLQSPIAVTSSGEASGWVTTFIAPNFLKKASSVTFAEGAATGNISEVGIAHGDGRATLFSRALVKDSNGDPTTVTVLSDESLIMYWELWIKIPDTDFSNTLGDGTVVTFRPSKITTHSIVGDGWSPVISRVPAPTNKAACAAYESSVFLSNTAEINPAYLPVSSITLNPYVAGTYTRSWVVFWNTDVGNFATGIGRTIVPAGGGVFQCSFVPSIPKTNLKTLRITYSCSWGRYEGALP